MKFYSPISFNDTMKINTGWFHVTEKSTCEVSKPTKQRCGLSWMGQEEFSTVLLKKTLRGKHDFWDVPGKKGLGGTEGKGSFSV